MHDGYALWRPTANHETLQQRAILLQKTRHFFYERGFLEVETPLLSQFTVTDPHLVSFSTDTTPPLFLQTSPEYHMKRLLAAGSGPIFQITKSFRKEEKGTRHNPEFTILEWYRPGYTHHDLMDEMEEFLLWILNKPCSRLSYETLFLQILNVNPLTASLDELKQCVIQQNIHWQYPEEDNDRDTYLDLLLSHCIEPQLGLDAPVFIYDYPASQAALSVKRGLVGERFEVYYKGIELANGFHELTDAIEQRQRFSENIKKRQALSLPELLIDEYFLRALEESFPPSSGVALGLDRLIMLALNKKTIKEVMAFSIDNA